MDAIDLRIIEALREDGRMPYARIATRLGVSPGMIRQRVIRLARDGVMQVRAVTNPFRMGYAVMALIGIKADVQRIRRMARQLSALDEVVYLVLSSGTYDLLVEVVCRDNAHLVEFLTERLASVEGIRDTETFLYLEILKDTP